MSAVPWWGWVLAVLAGSVGALVQTGLVRALARHEFPLGVLVANTTASAIGGSVVAGTGRIDPVWVLVIVGGLCGGLSTVSTLACDTAELWLEGRRWVAVRNVGLNVALGIGAAWGAWTVVS
ncbi:camphor resistance protein CrcB [Intrasporangium oryzae NRRL B-24470]|uniref:Fluoride-specific ion channel FluC n=1 Tax=Intrasporangium oryzae NRRL B-24470 TaxID=1386089 RepID=W9G731_9MICO|nr:CrcB family protein [Intrasporangium oryzae]EWS99678.1 camphor resistance protein CrcB [Intrasporangium oryzae NRRL B-24470]